MKLLKARQHSKTRAIIPDGEEIEVADFPLIYDKNGWMVFEDNTCEICNVTYLLQYGKNETYITCQTKEQIVIYIPNFKTS